CADRQLQGRSGACARSARAAWTIGPRMAWHITFSPPFPPLLLPAAGAVGLVLIVLAWRGGLRGGALRLLALAAVILALLGPSLPGEGRAPLPHIRGLVRGE